MGAYDSYFTGRITIAPPLTWGQIINNTARVLKDLRLATTETVEDTPTGRITTITSNMIEPIARFAYNGHDIHAELQSLIDAFPDNEFTGTITADPEDPHGDPWRYIIRGRTVVRQEPQTTWVDSEYQQ